MVREAAADGAGPGAARAQGDRVGVAQRDQLGDLGAGPRPHHQARHERPLDAIITGVAAVVDREHAVTERGLDSFAQAFEVHTENELPQPQLPVVLGLPNLKPAPCRPST